MQLKSATLYYGTSAYPINNPLPAEISFAPLAGKLLDEVCAAVALASGCLSAANVRDRVTHNVALTESRYPMQSGGEVVIPASVQLIGNGFAVVWH